MAGTKRNLTVAGALGAIDVIDSLLNKQTTKPKPTESMMSDFMAEMKSDKHLLQLSKPYLFYVEFVSADTIFSATNAKTISFLCHRCNIPGFHFDMKDSFISGIPYKVPVGLVQEDFRCTFYVDRGYRIPQMFEEYRSAVMNSDTSNSNFLFKYKRSYQFTININVLDVTNQNNDIVMMYQLQNCIIDSVSYDNLDYASTQQTQQVNIHANYEYNVRTPIDRAINSTAPSAQKKTDNILNKLGIPLNFDTVRLKAPQLGAIFDQASSYGSKAKNIGSTIKNFF